MSSSDILKINRIGKTQYTFAHPLCATYIAQWISTNFAVKVSSWIEEWKKSSSY